MKEMIRKIGETCVIKMRVVNMALRNRDYIFDNNIRTNPFYSEFSGMMQMLKTMDFEFDVEWDEEVKQMTAITIMNQRFEV